MHFIVFCTYKIDVYVLCIFKKKSISPNEKRIVISRTMST